LSPWQLRCYFELRQCPSHRACADHGNHFRSPITTEVSVSSDASCPCRTLRSAVTWSAICLASPGPLLSAPRLRDNSWHPDAHEATISPGHDGHETRLPSCSFRRKRCHLQMEASSENGKRSQGNVVFVVKVWRNPAHSKCVSARSTQSRSHAMASWTGFGSPPINPLRGRLASCRRLSLRSRGDRVPIPVP